MGWEALLLEGATKRELKEERAKTDVEDDGETKDGKSDLKQNY